METHMKYILPIILASVIVSANAETTIYETKDKEGVPSFSNVEAPADKNAKK